LLAEICGTDDFGMMLYLGGGGDARLAPAGLAVVHVTLHTALRDVFEQLTEREILAKARLIDDFMRQIKGSPPKIGSESTLMFEVELLGIE
jgi:4-hydroxy-L-threonine phosphate dehydrogenase PdxA